MHCTDAESSEKVLSEGQIEGGQDTWRLRFKSAATYQDLLGAVLMAAATERTKCGSTRTLCPFEIPTPVDKGHTHGTIVVVLERIKSRVWQHVFYT